MQLCLKPGRRYQVSAVHLAKQACEQRSAYCGCRAPHTKLALNPEQPACEVPEADMQRTTLPTDAESHTLSLPSILCVRFRTAFLVGQLLIEATAQH